MNGFKQLYSIILLLVVLLLLNIYKQTKRERNNKINSKKNSLDNLRTNHLEFERIRHQADMRRLEEEQLKSYFLERMLEYSDKCYDIHILLFRPEINELNFDKIDDDNNNHKDVNVKQELKLSDKKIEIKFSSESDKKILSSSGSTSTNMETNNGVQQNSATNIAVYIFVICLIASLIKAALDISKSLKKKATSPSDEFSRKCSLQEFAMARQNNRRPSKISLTTRKTSSASPSPLLNYSKSSKMNQLTRNLSYTGTGIVTETASPSVKPTVIRPATLTRRSSFPVSLTMGQHILNTKLRRPSMDSFSEDDSSPDHKKRVRMIHRH